jgi:ABC-type Fe3+ transport system permease subunit
MVLFMRSIDPATELTHLRIHRCVSLPMEVAAAIAAMLVWFVISMTELDEQV